VAGWVTVFIAVNIIIFLLPWQVLVKVRKQKYELDHDIIIVISNSDPPTDKSAVNWRKLCKYWGGGFRTTAIIVGVGDKCLLFRKKNGTSLIIDW
jgi:hypothetical protein